MGNIIAWVHANWEGVLAIMGGLHVILNVLGKLLNNSAIEGLDNTLMSVVNLLSKKKSPTA